MKKFCQSLFFYAICAFGISLTIKAAIGVSSFNSLNVSLADKFSLKVGTVTIFMNLFFLAIYIYLSKGKKLWEYVQMFIAVCSFGTVINFFLYFLLDNLKVDSYLLNVFLFILGTIIAGIGTGQVLVLEQLKFPIEADCEALAQRTKFSFSFYRYGLDILFVSLSVILSLVFHLGINVREGTLLSLFLLSGAISWSKKVNLFQQLGQNKGVQSETQE